MFPSVYIILFQEKESQTKSRWTLAIYTFVIFQELKIYRNKVASDSKKKNPIKMTEGKQKVLAEYT